MNENCECPLQGYCQRHQMEKNWARWRICRGIDFPRQKTAKFWAAWEAGRKGATAPPDPKPVKFDGQEAVERLGVGGHLKLLLSKFFAAPEGGCGCGAYAAQMDAWGPDGCRAREGEIVAHLVAQAEERGVAFATTLGPPVARRLLKTAIRRAEREGQTA